MAEREDERKPLSEREDAGPTSPGVETEPRGNQDQDTPDVDKGVEKLDRIVNW
jgi:hypothetical protein